MITDLAYFSIGFSLFSAVVLLSAHLLTKTYTGLAKARIFGSLLICNLSALQLLHYLALRDDITLWTSSFYISQLFSTAPLFYFFCRAVLYPARKEARWKIVLIAPVITGIIFPGKAMFFASFFMGSVYFSILAYELFELRSQRKRFYVEMLALMTLIVIAGMTLILGVLMPFISNEKFVAIYAIMVALSFLPSMYIVVRFPDIVSIVEEAVSLAYASTTLGSVNTDRKLEQLEGLMLIDKIYMDEALNLSMLADQLGLSAHQTSELLNSKLGIGFSRYLRQHRINEAKRQLMENPKTSILSIALSVGFTSQSNFYTAFKEIEGISPGQFRDTSAK